jgi:LacI family transcriptional regulator
MVTIKEIAGLARVSSTTVSNVLHGRITKMKPETLERVRRIIKEKDYVSNMNGRSLARHGSRIIAVVKISSQRENFKIVYEPFFSEMIGALEYQVRMRGYFLMVYVSADVDECLRMAKSWNVEGIIVHGGNADDCACFMRRTAIPLVFIDHYFYDDGLPYLNVGIDDRQGAFSMAEYLIRQGHKKTAFFMDQRKPNSDYMVRWEGFSAAMSQHGLQVSEEDCIFLGNDYAGRHETLRNFVRTSLKKYSALFFVSDFLAADGINLFHDEGIRVPEDVSVCGFDDNIFAIETRPRLTTVHQDIFLRAFHAVELTLRTIRGDPVEERRIRLPVSLTIRDSVAAC